MKIKTRLTFPASDTMPGPATYQAEAEFDDISEDFIPLVYVDDIDDELGAGTAKDISSTSLVPE